MLILDFDSLIFKQCIASARRIMSNKQPPSKWLHPCINYTILLLASFKNHQMCSKPQILIVQKSNSPQSLVGYAPKYPLLQRFTTRFSLLPQKILDLPLYNYLLYKYSTLVTIYSYICAWKCYTKWLLDRDSKLAI